MVGGTLVSIAHRIVWLILLVSIVHGASDLKGAPSREQKDFYRLKRALFPSSHLRQSKKILMAAHSIKSGYRHITSISLRRLKEASLSTELRTILEDFYELSRREHTRMIRFRILLRKTIRKIEIQPTYSLRSPVESVRKASLCKLSDRIKCLSRNLLRLLQTFKRRLLPNFLEYCDWLVKSID